MKKFEQLKRLYRTITGYMDPYDFSDAMISGLIADFDRLFELPWKSLKEYMRNDLMMLPTTIKIQQLFYIWDELWICIWT